MRGRFKSEIGKGQKHRQQKGGSPSGSAPQGPHPSPWQSTVNGFWFLPDPARYHSVVAGGQARVCTHRHTQPHSAGRESGLWACTVEAAGLCHRTARASEPRLPCSEPLGRVLGKRVRPPSVQSLPWEPRIPTEHPLGVLSPFPCSPKRLAASPPFLPSFFPSPELLGRFGPCLLLPRVGCPHLTETRGPGVLCARHPGLCSSSTASSLDLTLLEQPQPHISREA